MAKITIFTDRDDRKYINCGNCIECQKHTLNSWHPAFPKVDFPLTDIENQCLYCFKIFTEGHRKHVYGERTISGKGWARINGYYNLNCKDMIGDFIA